MKYPTHIYGLYLALVLLTCLEVSLQHLDYDPVYSAEKAGLGRGSARPFCHCKRTKRPNARPKTAAAETISRGSLAAARPGLFSL